MIINNRDKVLELISTLTLIAGNTSNKYVYRGESVCHDDVSSSLYRELYEIDNEYFDIMEAQRRQLEQAKQFTKETDELRILAEIQHRGGKTNLIDFTTDLNVALFFACKFSNDTDGRIIFLCYQKWEDYTIGHAVQPSNMADAQKSVFVVPKKGYINDADVIVYPIPSELKADVLKYLESMYGITMATVYNDISGFIRHQREFQDNEAEFYAMQRSLRQGDYAKALEHSSKYIDHPEIFQGKGYAYYVRGLAYLNLGDVEKALDDLMAFDRYQWEGKPELSPRIRELIDKRREEERQREIQAQSHVEKRTPSVTHRIRLASHDQHGNSGDRTTFMLLNEYGYRYQQIITGGPLMVTVPYPNGKWWFWFNKDGYRRIDAKEIVWGEPFTIVMQPKGRNVDLPEVTVTGTYVAEEVPEHA